MPIAAAVAPALISTAGGLVGNMAGAGDRGRAAAAQQAALNEILGLSAPSIEQQMLSPEKYQVAGQLSPEAEELVKAGPSEMKDIAVDPRLRQAQMNALSQLQQISAGGLRPEDQAMLAKIQQGAAQQNRGAQEAILQQMQERGIGGSGAELAAKLSAAQNAYNQAAMGGLDVAGNASQRALEATGQAGQLGGQMEASQFNQAAQIAAAQDLINKYNAMNQQQVSSQNVANRNAAQASNLQNLQNISNQNVGTSNVAQQYNKNLYQQQFENKMKQAQAVAGAQNQQAQNYQQSAQNTANMANAVGGGIGQAFGALGSKGLIGAPSWQDQLAEANKKASQSQMALPGQQEFFK